MASYVFSDDSVFLFLLGISSPIFSDARVSLWSLSQSAITSHVSTILFCSLVLFAVIIVAKYVKRKLGSPRASSFAIRGCRNLSSKGESPEQSPGELLCLLDMLFRHVS